MIANIIVLWAYPVLGGVLSPPAVANGVVYFGADDISVNMYALNANTGAEFWSENLCGSDMQASPAVANGVVYVGCDSGEVYALNPMTGAHLWAYYSGNGVISPAQCLCLQPESWLTRRWFSPEPSLPDHASPRLQAQRT